MYGDSASPVSLTLGTLFLHCSLWWLILGPNLAGLMDIWELTGPISKCIWQGISGRDWPLNQWTQKIHLHQWVWPHPVCWGPTGQKSDEGTSSVLPGAGTPTFWTWTSELQVLGLLDSGTHLISSLASQDFGPRLRVTWAWSQHTSGHLGLCNLVSQVP